MIKNNREEIFKDYECKDGMYLYCIHCERTYPCKEYRVQKPGDVFRGEEPLQLCPYDDCTGDAVVDAVEWSDVRVQHPEYPEIPDRGVEYRLN